MDQRKCLSEHPFGTIKRAMGATYFLLKGKVKTTGEFALLSMGYNLARVENLLGFSVLMQRVRGECPRKPVMKQSYSVFYSVAKVRKPILKKSDGETNF